jgi:hypothetical protein
MITENATEFVQSLLNGNISSMTPQDKSFILENKTEILPLLLPILSNEIPPLAQEGSCPSPTSLFWALELSCLLKAEQTFDWLRVLCRIPTEILYQNLGLEFVTENLSYLLASVAGCRWSLLKAEIEDSSLDEFIRAACLETLVFLVANKTVKRFDIISYFYSLFQRILEQKLNDTILATHLSMSCVRLWPGECIEEIRELFGLGLVDTHFISLSYALTYLTTGKELCLEDTRLRMLKQDPLRHSTSSSFSKEQEEELCSMLKRVWQLRTEIKSSQNPFSETLDPKKKQKKAPPAQVSVLEAVQKTLSYDLSHCLTEEIPPADLATILSLFATEQGNLATISTYLSLYPNLPFLHYTLYKTYQHLRKRHEALEVLKNMLHQFPDYLMTRTEYALYLLRKGEGKKAHAMLGYAQVPSELYPKRSHFHISEWIAFAHVLGCCQLQAGKEKQARIYLEILKMIAPPRCRSQRLARQV